ncbi:MAG: D123-domain-containing protein [Linnemannia gamsii]|nr:MAG: D123-domain-containing protein [Linnemannia gamsii]
MTETEPVLVFPPLTHQRLENCAFSSWYPKFRSVSIKSKIIPLPEEFVSYLNADGVFIPGQSGLTLALSDSEDDSEDEDISNADRFKALQEATFRQRAKAGEDDSSDDEDEDDESEQGEAPLPHFPGLEREIERTIDEFEGAVFPKLNWSSPRDASWIAATNTLKCQNVADIFLLLKSSDFIAHDLAHAYEDCSDAPAEGVRRVRQRPETVELVLRKWFDLAPSMEFRCFVRDNKLVAISQRDMTYYDFLRGIQEELEDTIVDFFEDKVNGNFPDSDYTFDVYITRNRERIYLIDFNPFAQKTDSLLFEWQELLLLDLEDKETEATLPIMRLLESEAAGRHMQQPFSFNRYPADVTDLSNGQTVAEFAEAFYKKVQTAAVTD